MTLKREIINKTNCRKGRKKGIIEPNCWKSASQMARQRDGRQFL
jgi:hypothetical protein